MVRPWSFHRAIAPAVGFELARAKAREDSGDPLGAFRHLERAHVLGQAGTWHHVRVHVVMLRWALRRRAWPEVAGQVLRIVGALAKTWVGSVPRGNTGGANVSAFKPMPVPADLQAQIDAARRR